jgi:hypothetical protein
MKTSYERATLAFAAALLLIASASVSCAPQKKAYESPQAAVEDFAGAIRNYNLDSLLAIFGSESKRLFATEDPVADANLRKDFLRLYDEKHELVPDGELKQVLVVGNDPWPMPIPLVKSSAGWTFDTEAGLDEIINRRVGRNELSTIQACLAVGDAQREYYRRDRDGDGILEYAQHYRSSPGHQDGLYWPVNEGEPQSPIGELVATAADEGYGAGDTTFHGYHYRLLTSQGPAAPGGAYDYDVRGNQIGGFAVVAFPAAYGDSGVMTFLLSHDGIVYQKDLGEHTDTEAHNMKSFNPEGWEKVGEKDLAPIPAD